MFSDYKKWMLVKIFYLTVLWNFSIGATSLTEQTTYPAFCRQAVENDDVFAHFKRNPHFQQILEHVSYDSGREYLEFILNKNPDLISLFDRFRQNDSLGHPVIYDYGKFGWFSPTTLRYIKVASDLREQFGDLSKMHIVEIGGGYGGQCKILADLTGFASYTIIDLPEGIALAKKYLSMLGIKNVNFIENNNLTQVGSYDLVISNYAFSEIDRAEQQQYLERVINPTRNGYMTMNFIPSHLQFLSIDEFARILFANNRKGVVKKEHPNTHPDNLIITWKSTDTSVLSGKSGGPISSSVGNGNAVTYGFSGGRFGDNLVAYFHAKWLAYKCNLPFRYIPFPYSDQFRLSDEDRPLVISEFQNVITTTNEADLHTPINSTLYKIPYFPENTEYLYDPEKQTHGTWAPSFHVDWESPEFRAMVRSCLTLKNPFNVTQLPTDKITVGVHVRRGGGADDPSQFMRVPMKFPDDSYFIQQIERLSNFFKGYQLYVYILTDDLHPYVIAESYRRALKNPNIHFDFRKGNNGPSVNVLEDFLFMTKFDCLIISQSSFSLMASKISDHAIVITPVHPTLVNGRFIIDEVELAFNGNRGLPFSR